MGDALRERRTAGVVEPLGAGGPIGAAAQRGVVVVQPVQVVAGDVGRRLGIAVLQKQGQQVERERQMVGRGGEMRGNLYLERRVHALQVARRIAQVQAALGAEGVARCGRPRLVERFHRQRRQRHAGQEHLVLQR